MIERITSNTNPNLFVLTYNKLEYKINDLLMVPKFFFIPSIIEKRKPLSPTARRAGWVGCNILFSDIPKQICVYLVEQGQFIDKKIVLAKTKINKSLQTTNTFFRGWMLDTLNCIEKIYRDEFTLKDIYKFEKFLKIKHPNNNNIKAKLRQQLLFLRDKGIIDFLGKGKYKKINV